MVAFGRHPVNFRKQLKCLRKGTKGRDLPLKADSLGLCGGHVVSATSGVAK